MYTSVLKLLFCQTLIFEIILLFPSIEGFNVGIKFDWNRLVVRSDPQPNSKVHKTKTLVASIESHQAISQYRYYIWRGVYGSAERFRRNLFQGRRQNCNGRGWSASSDWNTISLRPEVQMIQQWIRSQLWFRARLIDRGKEREIDYMNVLRRWMNDGIQTKREGK